MKFAIIAGEPSGDILAAKLMSDINAEYVGIGGENMQREGLQSLFPMEELAVMGIAEVLPKLRSLYARINEAARFVAFSSDIEALITVDSPDFSFRVAKRVREMRPDLPIIHYVSPSIWAWRSNRIKKMKPNIDHVLCLLPFEPALYYPEDMSAQFVGHPVSGQEKPNAIDIERFQEQHPNLMALFPGSRKGEIKRHIEVYRQFWDSYSEEHKDAELMIPALDHVSDAIHKQFSTSKNVMIFSPKTEGIAKFQLRKNLLMHACKLAVATSGTVSFELAFANAPTIVGYRANRLTEFIYKRFVKTKYASLCNILLDKETQKELLFEDFTVENLLKATRDIDIAHVEADYREMRAKMVPPMRASESVLEFLDKY